MHLGVESCATVPQTIVLGFRSSHDPHSMPSCLSHERRKHCEGLCVEATMEGFILLAGNYPVAMTSMVCLCRSVVNGFNKVAEV